MLDFFFRDAVSFLNSACELIAISLSAIEVVIGKIAH
jgi:hypothetical protein